MSVLRWQRLLPGPWAGLLLAVALIATPAAFALLPQAEAGRLVARVLAREAQASLVLGVVLALLARVQAQRGAAAGAPQFSVELGLALGALFCTVLGYYALQPMMVAARAGQGALSFGQLHALSAVFYLVKLGLVLALAWRATAPALRTTPPSSS